MNSETIIVFNKEGMGSAEPALSLTLAATYLGLLDLEDRLPRSICFYGEGVRLATASSPLLEELETLAERGVDLICCGTCLNHLGLAPELRVGRVGNMKDIIAEQADAAKVITL